MGRNMEKKREYDRKYRQTHQRKKQNMLYNWRRMGIIHHDFELLYQIYMEASKCDFCKCELDTSVTTKKCLDHDHSITDKDNVRAILCFNCNVKDVFNPNKKLMKNNKSGIRNISYKQDGRWVFAKTINKKHFYRYFKTKTEAICFKFLCIYFKNKILYYNK